MAIDYVEINQDKAVKVRITTVEGNSLTLDFKFYASGIAYNVAACTFIFTVTDNLLQKQKYQVTNSQWTRPAANEIKRVINPFPLTDDTYKIDLTCTFPTGMIQTIIDGELVIRERLIHI